MPKAIGMIECQSIGAGVLAADGMVKAARVELLATGTVCPGKQTSLIGGDVGAVETAVETGRRLSAGSLVDSLIIPNVHESLFPAIRGLVPWPPGRLALGLVESFSIASLIVAADAAVKTADVTLVEVRLGMAIGGKAFFVLAGSVDAVQASVDVGAAGLADQGLLVSRVVIPAPAPELLAAMGYQTETPHR